MLSKLKLKTKEDYNKKVAKSEEEAKTMLHALRTISNYSVLSTVKPVLKNTRSVAIGRHIIPDAMMTKLTLSTGINMSATGTPALQIFRGNSVYDPDYSGVGNQPNGFDEFAAFYAHYRVHKVNVEAYVVTGNTTASTPQVFAVVPTNTTSTYAAWTDVTGSPYSKMILAPNANQGYSGRLNFGISTKKFFGLTEAQFSAEPYSALVTTNPTEQFYVAFYLQDVLAGAGSNQAYVAFRVSYDVEFFERKDLGLS